MQVSRLCDLSEEEGDTLTSVCWSERGTMLGLGTQSGHVQIWDTHAEKKVYDLQGHRARVGETDHNTHSEYIGWNLSNLDL